MALSTPGSLPFVQGAFVCLSAAVFRGDRAAFLALLDAVRRVDPAPFALAALAMTLSYSVTYLDAEGKLDITAELIQRLETIVTPVAEREPLAAGWVHSLYAFRQARLLEDPFMGLGRAKAAKACFERADYRPGVAIAQVLMGRNLFFLGAFGEAERMLSDVAIADADVGPSASNRPFILAWLLADRGKLDEAERVARGLIEAGRAKHHPLEEGRGSWTLAEVLRRKGELEEAERAARRALELLSFVPVEQLAIKASLSAIVLAQGRAAEALSLSEAAMAEYAARGDCGLFRGAMVRLVHAEALWASGDEARAREAISVARERLSTIACRIEDSALRAGFFESVPENARTLSLYEAWVESAKTGA